MTDTTTALPAPKERARRVPPKIREAIDRVLSGRSKSWSAAAKAVGLSREYVSRSLSLPHVAEFLRQKAARQVAVSSGRAAARLSQLIDSARSEHVALQASQFSLSCAGISPKNEASVNVSVSVRAGFVIDLSGRSDAKPMKIVSPDPDIPARPAPE
jgi:ParB-like chromosome segregation protein Spo0J